MREGFWLGLERFARLLLASVFLFSGIVKLFDFAAATGEVRMLTGVEPAAAIAALVILIQLGGAALLLSDGRSGVIGAILLGCFTLVATVLGHPFWTQEGVEQVRDATTFLEHLGLIGGLLLIAISRPRPNREA